MRVWFLRRHGDEFTRQQGSFIRIRIYFFIQATLLDHTE